jgi:glycerophosphoryl diester phosphodiesterase
MPRRLLAAVAALLVVPAAYLMLRAPEAAASHMPCPEVVAHRTGATIAPENTAVGITMAAQTGAAAVEMDVRWSVTGYPVLMHDATLDRTTNGTGLVADTGLNAMLALNAHDYAPWTSDPRFADVHVPYAWDFFNAASRSHVDTLLDVQVVPDEAGGRKLIEYADRFGYRTHLVYMSGVAGVQAMRQWFPDLTYLVIEYPPAGRSFTGEYLLSVGADGYAVPWDRVSAPLVAYLKSYGLLVYTWTSDNASYETEATWAKLTAAGVDAIVTNEPAALLAWEATGCTSPTSASPSGT